MRDHIAMINERDGGVNGAGDRLRGVRRPATTIEEVDALRAGQVEEHDCSSPWFDRATLAILQPMSTRSRNLLEAYGLSSRPTAPTSGSSSRC